METPVMAAALLAALAAAPAAAQTAIEYGAAAASKTAGAAAKGIGRSAGRILGKAGEALEGAGHGRAGGVRAAPRATVASQVRRVEPAPPVEFRATPEAFAKLEPGLSAAELEKLLGPPSFRMLMPEDGHLVEVLEYSAGRKPLGSVRLVDGKVAEVRPAAR